MDTLVLALTGKKASSKGTFDKAIKMVDEMVDVLAKEQQDDDNKKEYCEKQFDVTDDKKKSLERTVSDEDSAIAAAKEGIAKMTEEMAALEAGIKDLDKSVAEATAQRKEEHADFKELIASDSAAKELLGMAKNRLNKFYNPKLYKAPAKEELSAGDRIYENMGGAALAQVRAHNQRSDAPASPPPSTWEGGYKKKSEESNGVIGMIDLLVKDLDKEMTEAKTEEKDAQADYETMMEDSADKRTMDAKTLTSKEGVKADTEAALSEHKKKKTAVSKDLAATLEYIGALHADCDWLLKY